MTRQPRTAGAHRVWVFGPLLALAVACGGGGDGATPGEDATAPRDGGGIVFADTHSGGDAASDATNPLDDIDASPDTGAAFDVDSDAPPTCSSDGECTGQVAAGPCLVARCEDGQCRAAPLEQGRTCDDGDPCTGDGLCDGAGVCEPGPALPCSDDDPCTDDTCEPERGCVNLRRAVGADCADPNDPCDGSTCDATGRCEWKGKPNGFPCSTGEACDESRCQGGVCVPTAAPDNKPCDDENPCSLEDHCEGGVCRGTPRDCDDDDPCTTDACDRETGECIHDDAPSGTRCDDADPCTDDDACDGGTCQPGAPVDCDDDDPCTTDSCSAASGWCTHGAALNGTACDDGNPCTQIDICSDGACSGTTPLDCDDGDPCTVDRCDAASGSCVKTPGPNGIACAGDDPCLAWTCQAGVCAAQGPKDCDDGNPCTQNLCQAGTGACQHPPVAGTPSCDDGDICTLGDTCQGGECVGGPPPDCDDDDPCTVDGCDAETGDCTWAPGNDGAPCDDGEPCSTEDVCSGGACHGAWSDPFCCRANADCAAYDSCVPGVCAADHCLHEAPVCAATPGGCTANLCDGTTGDCGEVLLCGPHLLWGADFEDAGGLLVWPPDAWHEDEAAAADGGRGLRVRALEARGPIRALGPPVVIPRGTAELRLQVRLASDDVGTPNGALTVAFVDADDIALAETTVDAATDGWLSVVLSLGSDVAQTGRLSMTYDGQRGVLDVDQIRLVHYGLNGCVRSRIHTLPTHAAVAEQLAISRGEGGEVLIGWTETDGTTGQTEVSAMLLDPLRGEASTRRLLSQWEDRPDDIRVRAARAMDGTFLVLYPGTTASQTIEGAIIGDIAAVPRRILLPLDYDGAWAIDATAVAPQEGSTWDGWVALWSGPNLNGNYNSLRTQRFSTDGEALDVEPWRGGPNEWRDARHLEAAPLPDDGRLVAWVARRAQEPVEQAVLARRLTTHLSPPPVSGSSLYVLALADPLESSLAHLRLAPIGDGFALSVMRGDAAGAGPWQLEVRRFGLDATPLAPTDAAEQIAHESVLDSTPAPLVGLPDGGVVVAWRHRVATLEFVWYRRMDATGAFHPPAGSPPSVLAGSGLPFVSRGAPDAVPYGDRWVLSAWPAGDQSIEYRLLGVGCADGLARCNGAVAEVCAGDRYLPFAATCEGAGCGVPLTCE